ncbi:YheC/YheD family protein [Paenibacillus zeisoli]|uniref:YheC/YheD family protein n=1 Tax=Paenibacillus zeisoli TaxID=2496267 RepID=A0A433X691_9BACL|nr:YheC/YheD family protein [Paenibacillus zeisoli]RUT29517.1 YheC/YheD family protein [Paenibacillus zeisoli]
MIGLHEEPKPLIAILTSHDKYKRFQGNRKNFRDIAKMGKDLDIPVFVVTSRDLKLSGNKVLGYAFIQEKKLWEEQWFPLPNVIYNRIPQRKAEERPAVRRKIESCLAHPDIHLFNPFFFNKWELFAWLRKSHSTKSFVPATKRLTGYKALSAMIRNYPNLYLKPESGKAGKGIMRLKYVENESNPLQLTIQSPRKIMVVKSSSLSEIWKRIRNEIGMTNYIVQEGIELVSHNGRQFDLRVLVQKNGKGQWLVTGIGARQAGHRRITTHVPQGGSVEDPEELLALVFGRELTSGMMNRVKSNALLIARQIERGSGHMLGEMSMDLGVDMEGKIWFFEANAKPMKFDEPHIRKKSLERIFQYSQYLVKQSYNS